MQEDTLLGFYLEFTLARNENVDEAGATKNSSGKTEERLAIEEKSMGVWSCNMEDDIQFIK